MFTVKAGLVALTLTNADNKKHGLEFKGLKAGTNEVRSRTPATSCTTRCSSRSSRTFTVE